jgi:hypothetical protein
MLKLITNAIRIKPISLYYKNPFLKFHLLPFSANYKPTGVSYQEFSLPSKEDLKRIRRRENRKLKREAEYFKKETADIDKQKKSSEIKIIKEKPDIPEKIQVNQDPASAKKKYKKKEGSNPKSSELDEKKVIKKKGFFARLLERIQETRKKHNELMIKKLQERRTRMKNNKPKIKNKRNKSKEGTLDVDKRI